MTIEESAVLLKARTAREVVKRFRECRSFLDTFSSHLAALENISHQKVLLAGAVRRQQRDLFPLRNDLGVEQSVAGGCCDNDFSSSSSAVATAPLGVLSAFSPSFTDDLMGQHQEDQRQLLRSLSGTAQAWAQKTNAVAHLVATLEESVVDSGGGGGESRKGEGSASAGAQRHAPSRKALLRQAAEALYGRSGSPLAPSPPFLPPASPSYANVDSGGLKVASVLSSQTAHAVYVRETGLASLSQVQRAVHGLLSSLVKMSSVLQECVLALRGDLLLCSCDGRRSASLLREFLLREAEEERFVERQHLCDGPAEALQESASVENGAVSSDSGDGVRSFESGASALVVGKACEPLTFLDALTELRESLEEIWEKRCQGRFLNEDSVILLAG